MPDFKMTDPIELISVLLVGADDSAGGIPSLPLRGAGSPEGVVSAPVGSLYLNTEGGAGTTASVKESGAGSTGWVAK